MEFIKEILTIIDLYAAAFLVYYIITGLCVLKEKEKIKHGNINHKFGIIIPARNEEKVIANLLKSLKKQEYPKELYDIYVVVNNCKDKTKEIALANGVKVIECVRPVAAKGTALRLAFKKLQEKDYDAYLVFDADNIVHPKFISKMNDAFCMGYELAQGFRDSKNPSSTWVSSSYSLHYLIHNIFLNNARMHIDKSSFINGTGFMVSKNFLDKRNFKAHTLTEDLELTAQCALENKKIAYVEDAITYDEQVETFKKSWKQRKRWSIGTIQCFKYYFSPLLKKGIKNKRFACIDAIIFFSAPFTQFLTVISYIGHIMLAICTKTPINYGIKIVSMMIGYFASVILSIIAVKYSKKHIMTYIKGIIMLPIFILTWIPINVMACFSKKNKWEQIEHNQDITIENMMKAS